MITLGRAHGCYLKALSDRKSRRHDEDDMIPRSLDEMFDLNRAVAKKMEDVMARPEQYVSEQNLPGNHE